MNNAKTKAIEEKKFGKWLNRENNLDVRMPMNFGLSFLSKLSIEEGKEFIKYIYKKSMEERDAAMKEAEKERAKLVTCCYCSSNIHVDDFGGVSKKGIFHSNCFLVNEIVPGGKK